MMTRSDRRWAYEHAATLLELDMDRVDMPDEFSEKRQEETREFIRNTVAGYLRKKAYSLRDQDP